MSDITDDMEKVLLELTDEHQMQWGEIMSLVHNYLRVHCPDSQEQYVDGGSPEYYYGPRKEVRND